MHEILDRLDSTTRLLVASIRSAADIGALAAAGLDTYTLNAAVAAELFSVRETLDATTAFEAAVTAPVVSAVERAVARSRLRPELADR